MSIESKAMAGDIPVYCSHDEIVDIMKVIPNPKNPNMHPEQQIELLSQIIKAQGWRKPITVSKRSGFIVSGHGRLQAALVLGVKQVPIDYQDYATEAEEYADLIADNRLAELSNIDDDLLSEILKEIDTEALELTGYTEDDLNDILNDMLQEDEEEQNAQDVELEQELSPMCQKGDLWEMGEHRLIIGDATDEATIEQLMNGQKAHMVHTDPPYGVSYQGAANSGNWEMIKNDDKTGDDLFNNLLLPAFNNYRKHTIPQAAFYIWHASSTRRDFEDAMMQAGLAERQYLIWAKNGISLGRADYQHAHEPCFYAAKEGETPNYYGDRAQHTVWRVTTRQDGKMMTVLGSGLVLTDGTGNQLYVTDKPAKGKKVRYVRMEEGATIDLYKDERMQTIWEVARETGYLHPTQKPVEIPIRAIENSSQEGEIVLDFFGGSGSTLIGAEKIGRVCYCTELDPKYGDVIVSRYVMETGNIGITCKRNGKTYSYMDLVKEWAKDNGKEDEMAGMKTPVVTMLKDKAS